MAGQKSGRHLELVHSVEVPKVTRLMPKNEGEPDAYIKALDQLRRNLDMEAEGPLDEVFDNLGDKVYPITSDYDPNDT